VVAVCASGASASIVIETVLVGNPGNAPDTRYEDPGYGAVDYTFNMGKYEVISGQYTAFLNAVAATDTYWLYNWRMVGSSGIERSGSSGSYTYSVAADWANRPANFVSWGDAARFCNWLHNGQPTGAQDLSTTEDGSYFLNGATGNGALMAIGRKGGATWVIPTEDEWYKAAYHKNDAVTGNYWDYPTSSDSMPSNVLGNPTDPGNNATFYDINNATPTIGAPYWYTVVGDHENSDSPYGTFDQGGNVWEWNEALLDSGFARGLRGASASSEVGYLRASYRFHSSPSFEYDYIGFRVSQVPEPSSLAMLAFAGMLVRRRRRGRRSCARSGPIGFNA
jgi:formylglycine-generating enzyme required for sulfatase activity